MGVNNSKSGSSVDYSSAADQVAIRRKSRWKEELFEAVNRGQLSKVRQYSALKSLVNCIDEEHGTTPLLLAVQLGKLDIVRCLIKAGADVNKKDYSLMNALHIAATKGYTQITEALLQSHIIAKDDKDLWGWTPLHRAIINRHEDTAIMLLNYGASINIPDENKRVTLHIAAGDGQVSFVHRLLAVGANANMQDSRKRTPLYLAVVGRQVEVIKLLIKHGCDLDLPTVVGLTPLYLAIKKGMVDIVELLVSGGAKSIPHSGVPGNIEAPVLVHLINLGAGNKGTNKKAESYLQIACLLIKQDSKLPLNVLEAVLTNYSTDHPQIDLLNQIIRLILLSGVSLRFPIPDTVPLSLKNDLEEWCQGHLPPSVPTLLEICRQNVRRHFHEKYQNVVYAANRLRNVPPVLIDFILLQA